MEYKTDSLLVHLARAGDEDACEKLVKKYYSSIYQYCLLHIYDSYEAEDLTQEVLKEKADHIFLLYGDNSDKENAEIRVKLKQIPENESLILVATGQKIGEGFDFPRLDVLMLAAPVSFEGRLEQYVGRLNRDYVGKEAVYVYDYIDSHVRYFDKMYAKRLRTYRKMGFSIWTQELQPKQIINAIFGNKLYMSF